jgi:hypothetical protein
MGGVLQAATADARRGGTSRLSRCQPHRAIELGSVAGPPRFQKNDERVILTTRYFLRLAHCRLLQGAAIKAPRGINSLSAPASR